MDKMKDFYKAWHYLANHKHFEDKRSPLTFEECLDIDVVKVNPSTKSVDDNEKLNTETNVWLECGKMVFDKNVGGMIMSHDIRMDCGAETFEKAIIKLANIVENLERKKTL